MSKNIFTTEQLSKLIGVEIPSDCEIEVSITEPDEPLNDAELAQISGGGMSFREAKNISRIRVGFRKGISSYLKTKTPNSIWEIPKS